ncbi:MAG: peptidylprolyl isomerase fpr4 [Thelocarpon superellum]|nr:MAG: peptidylprolyl isomerase fpr4 [Thelocarpon superellum]
MASLIPMAVYGLEVPRGGVLVPAFTDFPSTIRLTMAAIDPYESPEEDLKAAGRPQRATLRIEYRARDGMDDSDDDGEEGDSDDDEYLKALLAESDSDEDEDDDDDDDEDDEEDEEKNGGPSDPSKSKKARKEKQLAELQKILEEKLEGGEGMDLGGDKANGVNGIVKSNKGKAKANGEEDLVDSDEDDEDDDEDALDHESFVVCTLDPNSHYQQAIDLTIREDEDVYFRVYGTHSIFLTGNYVNDYAANLVESDEDEDEDGEAEEYDLSPDDDELEDESDELDALADPRITELLSDEDEAPTVVKKAEIKKGKNKRPAEDSDSEPANLDDIMAKSLKPANGVSKEEPKLSKKQLKKLKNNAGEAVVKTEDQKAAAAKDSPVTGKGDKKVQFAKELEQGPSPSTKATAAKPDSKPKGSLGVKIVQGVTVDDRKLGTGRAAKKGDTVSMRYIGKLQSNGQRFDANTGGEPFKFKLGTGEVIKGWDIGVAGMSVGGERKLTIPANLAYGKKKAGQIPPNSTLLFELKLLGIK